MGIKFLCPSGHKLHVKAFLAGKKAICPRCGARVVVPSESQEDAEAVDLQSGEEEFDASLSQATAGLRQSNREAPMPSIDLSDPFAAAPGAAWYVRPQSGGQFGPAKASTMRAWLDEGRVGAGSMVWRDGWAEWRSASEIFPQLGEVSASTAPPLAKRSSASPASTNGDQAFPPLPQGQLPGAGISPGADLSDLLTATPMQPRSRRKRQNDSSLIASAILAVVVVILVFVLILVWRSQQTPSDDTTTEKHSATPVSASPAGHPVAVAECPRVV